MSTTKTTPVPAAGTAAPELRGISEIIIAAIVAKLAEINNLYAPYAVTLTPLDRRRLTSAGIKNLGFIETAYTNAAANPSLVPNYLNITEFKNNLNDVRRKQALYNDVLQLLNTIGDSLLTAGNLAYGDALEYYNAVKEAARQRVPGAEAAYNLLKPYFKKSKPATNQPTQTQLLHDVEALLHGKKEGKIVIENENPALTGGKRIVEDEVETKRATFNEHVNEEIRE